MSKKTVHRNILALTIALAGIPTAACKRADNASPAPSPSAAASVGSVAPPAAPSATTSAALGPRPALSPAEQQRYEAAFAKCQQVDAASCEAVCDEFDAQACTYLTSLMLASKVPDDPTRRAKINEKGCAKGALKSCNQLATAYKKGDGVPADIKKAVELYQKACDGGEGSGCTHLATIFGYGDLAPQDLDKAKAYSKKACELGDKNCKPPLGNGSWPRDAKLEDVVVDQKKWNGELVQLRDVAAYRGSPTSGYVFARGGNPMTDGVPTMLDADASEDTKQAWLKMPSSRSGIPVKKVTVRVEATAVPGRARLWIVDALQFVGTQD